MPFLAPTIFRREPVLWYAYQFDMTTGWYCPACRAVEPLVNAIEARFAGRLPVRRFNIMGTDETPLALKHASATPAFALELPGVGVWTMDLNAVDGELDQPKVERWLEDGLRALYRKQMKECG